MKIKPVNTVIMPKINRTALSNKNIFNKEKVNSSEIFKVYFGRDLVKADKNGFENTVKQNYYHLPKGCKPDAFQLEAGRDIYKGKDVIAEAPTGIGKTAIAYYTASKNMSEGKKTIYTTPLKALSNQKLREFREIFGPENVGILTGDTRDNADAPIIIMTTEVYRNIAVTDNYKKDNSLMDNLGSVIFDEFHYLGDASRGKVWEESVMFTPKDVQILALSATIGNAPELKNWISQIKGDNVSLVSVPEEARPVPLTYIPLQTGYYERTERIGTQKGKKNRENNTNNMIRQAKPSLKDFKNVVNILQTKDHLPSIIFVFSKRSSKNILEYLGKYGDDLTTEKEKEQIKEILDKYGDEINTGEKINYEALMKGYAIHNAGIMPKKKELTEELFQKKLLKVIISTETLAAGINMPARTVVLTSPFKPSDEPMDTDEKETEPIRMLNKRELTANEFKQMSGRAGRRGIDKEGFVYTLSTDLASEMAFEKLKKAKCNPISSKYRPGYSFLCEYYKYFSDENKLKEIFSKSFCEYKAGTDLGTQTGGKTEEEAQKRISILKELGYIDKSENGAKTTLKGEVASKFVTDGTLPIAEVMTKSPYVLEGITPTELAMIAGSAADEFDEEVIIGNTEDMPNILDNEVKTIEQSIKRRLELTVSNILKKLGKDVKDFADLEDMYKYAKSIESPEEDEKYLKQRIENLRKIRSKLYRIDKPNVAAGKEKEIYDAIKSGEVIPTKTAEYYYNLALKYKESVKYGDIDTYIASLEDAIKSADKADNRKGKKTRAKINRYKEENQEKLEYAKIMKCFEEHLGEVISSNWEYKKRYDKEIIQDEYEDITNKYIRLTSKESLKRAIESLKDIEEVSHKDDAVIDIDKYYKALNKSSLDVSRAEKNNDMPGEIKLYGKAGAEILYLWTKLNEGIKDSKTNWTEMYNELDRKYEGEYDEGTIFRTVMQAADILGQIKDGAEIGYNKSESIEEKEYYLELKNKAEDAIKLIIKEPIIG